MSFKRLALMIVPALLLSVLGFAGLHGTGVLAQDGEGPGPVVFASDRTGNYEVFVLDPQTGLTTQLTNSPATDIEPDWSPDGSLVTFVSDRDGDFELYIMRADGTDLRQITFNNAAERLPRWQPNGEYIVYSSDVNGQWDLYVISADGAVVRQLTNDPADERGPLAQDVPAGDGGAVPGGAATPFPTLTPVVTAQPDGTVSTYRLNVRSNPGTGANILTTLNQGAPVEVLAQYYSQTYDETWVQIRAADGTVGWVLSVLLDLNLSLANVPAIAAQYIAPPPTATPTPAVTATPTVLIEFWANKGTITKGECVTLSWRVQGIKEVYFQGQGVVGEQSVERCPEETTTYHLRVVLMDDTEDNRYITITVNEP